MHCFTQWTCSFFMQDCSEGDLRAALSNNGCTKFVNFTILFEKPIACQSVVSSSTKQGGVTCL